MLEIQPQITVLMSVNKQQWKVKEINKIAQDEFNINGEEKFNDFLTSVNIDNDSQENIEETERNMLENNLLTELNNYIKMHFDSKNYIKRTDTYFGQDPSNCP